MFFNHAVVADANAVYRLGFTKILETSDHELDVVEAESLATTAGAIDATSSDLLIIDLGLPGLNGLAGLKELHRHHPQVKILVTSENFSDDVLLDCLTSGFHGCLEKTSTASQVLEALKRAAEGGVYISHPITEVTPLHDTGKSDEPLDNLTPRQRAVIEKVAEGMSNKEVARALGICEGTVKVHVNAAYKVLGVHNRVAAAIMLQKQFQSSNAADQTQLAF